MHLTSVHVHSDAFPTKERYPFAQDVLQDNPTIPLQRPVTFFVGENGTGKSTLLRAIAHRCHIPIWEYETTTHVDRNPFRDMLYRFLTVTWVDGPVPGSFFGSETFRDWCKLLDEWAVDDPGQLRYFGGRSLLTLSHGQSLMAYFRSRYEIPGLYLLDEPETALSPRSQIELVRLIDEMGRRGHAQFIVATHSPILLACPDAQILSFDRAPLCAVAYEDTDHYRVYRSFLQAPQASVRETHAEGGVP